jgi:hypothetical protein
MENIGINLGSNILGIVVIIISDLYRRGMKDKILD